MVNEAFELFIRNSSFITHYYFKFPTHSFDFHSRRHYFPARQRGFGVFGFIEPHLTIGAVAVPAEFAERNRSHRQKLKTPEQRVVFGNFARFAENFDGDEFLERLENIRIIFCVHFQ